MLESAVELAQNDRAAHAYTWSRRRDLTALGAEMGPVGNLKTGEAVALGYATVVKTAAGWEVRHRDVIVLCAGFVCAQAYILAKFW